MNKHDRDNLSFILSLDPQGFDQWMKEISIDDVEYALELLIQHRAELCVQEVELLDQVDDLTEATQVINFIRSK